MTDYKPAATSMEMTKVTVKDDGAVLGAQGTQKQPAASPITPAMKAGAAFTVVMVFIIFVISLVNFDASRKNENLIEKKLKKVINKMDDIDLSTSWQYSDKGAGLDFDSNYCSGTKPGWANFNCTDAVIDGVEQAGANVTEGFVGLINNNATPPLTTPYYQNGLCPVNVHWHLGAEHLSVGQYDEKGDGPDDSNAYEDDDYSRRRLGSSTERLGYQCRHYDEDDSKFTTSYNWEHCTNMIVGQTYEIHWPHSTVGACGTPYQYQTPFYDGVFCNFAEVVGNASIQVQHNVGVQSQVFTVVNDEAYYYPDLIKGMIVAGDYGDDIAYYTGSTTGTSRDNEICSAYSPITWQVDRTCHMISASSFDKMCADMKAQVDDMSKDLYPHGARKLVTKELSSTQEV